MCGHFSLTDLGSLFPLFLNYFIYLIQILFSLRPVNELVFIKGWCLISWNYLSSTWKIVVSTSHQQPPWPGQAQEESQGGCGHQRSRLPRGFSDGRQWSGSLWRSGKISAAPHWPLSIPQLSGQIRHTHLMLYLFKILQWWKERQA